MVRPLRSLVLLLALALTASCLATPAGAATTARPGGVTVAVAAKKKTVKKRVKRPRSHKAAKRRAVKRPTTTTPSRATPTPAVQDCGVTTKTPAVSGDPVDAATILCLVNNERAKAGLQPLRASATLARAAQVHSDDMVARQYFAHLDPLGLGIVARVVAAGWATLTQTWHVGENIAWGSGPYASPKSVVRRWMESAGHRENMLNATFREAGVGVAAGSPSPQSLPGATYTLALGVHA
jgi:uncharacterized protein YkwD